MTVVGEAADVHRGGSSRVLDLGFARLDVDRQSRTGLPEVVYAEGKTPEQVVGCLAGLLETSPVALATRVDDETAQAIRHRWPDADLDAVARCARVGVARASASVGFGQVAVVSAGTSDRPVAAEAAFVANAFGIAVARIDDVGVAGLHRLTEVRDDLERADVVIVVAGMDGALASAVGGLISTPVIAVPTSVGYGAAFGGLAALLTMLNSCAPGVVVTNIDNGFGAAAFAVKVLSRRAGTDSPRRDAADGPATAPDPPAEPDQADHDQGREPSPDAGQTQVQGNREQRQWKETAETRADGERP